MAYEISPLLVSDNLVQETLSDVSQESLSAGFPCDPQGDGKKRHLSLQWDEYEEVKFELSDRSRHGMTFSYSASPDEMDVDGQEAGGWTVSQWSPDGGVGGGGACGDAGGDQPAGGEDQPAGGDTTTAKRRTTDAPSSGQFRPEDFIDEYSDEFFEWTASLEQTYHCKPFLQNQPQVHQENRSTLIAWLSKVCRSYEFYQETLFLTVNILDRFLLVTPIAIECFQLLGLSALLIAAKQLEVNYPNISEMLSLSAGAYSRQHFLQMERIILKQLRFNFVVPTAIAFFEYFTIDIRSGNSSFETAHVFKERPVRQMARNLLELCVQDYKLNQYLPSCMALAAMAVVEEYATGRPVDLQATGRNLWHVTPGDVKMCATEMWLYMSKVLDCPLSELASVNFFQYPHYSGE